MTAPRRQAAEYPEGDIEPLHAGSFFECLEYSNNAYTPALFDPLSPLPSSRNGADYSFANDFGSNAANFPSENVAEEMPLNATPGSFTPNYGDFSPQRLDDFAWMDHGSLQSLPTQQPNQITELSSGQFTWPTTTSPCGTIEDEEPTSKPSLPRNLSRGYRGLPRRKSGYMIQKIDQRSNATFIPPTAGPADPLERWKESPPEGEAASLSAIKNALENFSTYSSGPQRPGTPGSRAGELFQKHRSGSRAPSTASRESATSISSQRSNRSGLSALSNGSQTASDRTSAGFKNKFDWTRHEKSLHLNLEAWACAPFGGSVVLESTGRAHCAYCNQLDPSLEHLEQHNHGPCQQQKRTFRRKDHLLQHLRLFHRLDVIPLIEEWKRVVTDFPSRCGFCDGRMSTWDERADHLTFHFRKGCTMANWKGDHDFPPDITAQVTNSVPPYLLDFESRTFVPFSATNRDTNDHLSQMLSRATFVDASGMPQVELQPVQEPRLNSYTEVLTHHLSHYAQQMMSRGIIPTDEMFQAEARRLSYDSEDQWDQTIADNLEWLAKFRAEQSSKGAFQTPEQGLMG
ncbi:hypothetical protein PENNAL_c0051G03307 [Penicillium nalgiovense]|uniref:C2H2-type domain-containing protein n=1 Tax=Penicillium nalgiovense TaxID=60175 RepID=A0A1V6XWP9_PENNA|nr:hypothetical protein PENNAL_c0051G03307 [Penicillium nalgiovense]